ncbi:MAG: hypothetical protein HY922_09230 [Elusimicrobia bacterium]|nr:hypothetical protein [Elusimicrobiota bacterium]
MKHIVKAATVMVVIALAALLSPRAYAIESIESLRMGSELGFHHVLSGAKNFRLNASRSAVPGIEASAASLVIDDRMENAKFLLDELRRTNGVCYSQELIRRLKALTKTAPYSEALQRFIVAGLFADLHRAENLSYDLFVVETLGDIASYSPYPIQVDVLRGIMNDILRVNQVTYSLQVLGVFTRVAVDSRSEDVKEAAISLLEADIRRVDVLYYSKRLLVMIDKIRSSR